MSTSKRKKKMQSKKKGGYDNTFPSKIFISLMTFCYLLYKSYVRIYKCVCVCVKNVTLIIEHVTDVVLVKKIKITQKT